MRVTIADSKWMNKIAGRHEQLHAWYNDSATLTPAKDLHCIRELCIHSHLLFSQHILPGPPMQFYGPFQSES